MAVIVKPGFASNAGDAGPGLAERQAGGDARPSARDRGKVAVTSGALSGLSGDERRALILAWAFAMGITGVVNGLNILGRLQDAPTDLVTPFVDEASSFLVLALAFCVPGALALWLRRARPSPLAAVGVIGAGLPAFALIHLGGCALLRALVYPSIVGRADESLFSAELPYEIGKDVLSYAAAVVGFAVILALRIAPPRDSQTPATFDIQDGSRLIRAPLGDILAVRSAGNYAEFLLGDGRRPLMRTSLAGLQASLEPLGFVRVHRSWLVNSARVTGLRPEGSGDYSVELGQGVEAPLSRRFPAALTSLRA
jgi:LytTr DNA-binding domain